jgi:hypothetical protein
MSISRYFCPIVTELVISQQILITVSNIKFHENPSSRGRADTCGKADRLTDRRDEGNRRFREYVNAPKMVLHLPGIKWFLGCAVHNLVTTATTLYRIPLFAVETELLETFLNKLRTQKEAIPWMSEWVNWLVLTYAVYLTLFVMDGFLFCKRVQTYANENIVLAIEITLAAWLLRQTHQKRGY